MRYQFLLLVFAFICFGSAYKFSWRGFCSRWEAVQVRGDPSHLQDGQRRNGRWYVRRLYGGLQDLRPRRPRLHRLRWAEARSDVTRSVDTYMFRYVIRYIKCLTSTVTFNQQSGILSWRHNQCYHCHLIIIIIVFIARCRHRPFANRNWCPEEKEMQSFMLKTLRGINGYEVLASWLSQPRRGWVLVTKSADGVEIHLSALAEGPWIDSPER